MTEPKVYGMIEEAAGVLHASSFREDAREVRDLLADLRGGSGAQHTRAREAIIQRCHVRWLGDLNIRYGTEPYGWTNFLGDIQRRLEQRG